jgi:hypothetical protein
MDDVGANPLFNDLPTSDLANTGMAVIDVLYGLGL